ncbi:gametocyte-specific factor 1 homolog [Drosophila yakuba]|uniref:CHHC U11-48K-type domain-containing protein n=1 Tax=Drosophila yakuba TaxID=7245 RepID=B4PM10_DROYA|nr:gametocyte-specific factor 1 homolog [Drosophila yakuba]EDW95942.2 uncharacterized protein Dyak_GE25178 [Drosophila yakuba]
MSKSNAFVVGQSFEEYLVCPYDSAHRIRPLRLNNHFIRCAKNFPSAKLARCPFNDNHLPSAAEMQKHVFECSDRASMERFKLPSVLPSVEPRPREFSMETGEDWDAEPPTPTYNSNIHCERNMVIRNLQGAPPAARREFREDQRKRFKEQNLF